MNATSPLLDRRALAKYLGIHTRTLDRFKGEGLILHPLGGPGLPKWHVSEVEAWVVNGRPTAEIWARSPERAQWLRRQQSILRTTV